MPEAILMGFETRKILIFYKQQRGFDHFLEKLRYILFWSKVVINNPTSNKTTKAIKGLLREVCAGILLVFQTINIPTFEESESNHYYVWFEISHCLV